MTAGRPIDIPPCQHPTDLCPPIKTEENEMTTTDLTEYARMARAFAIFAEYPGEQGVTFHHDEAYAGPDPAVVSPEHLIELEALGWHASDGEESFYSFNR